MYSVFERAISSYFHLAPCNADRGIEGDVLLAEVGADRRILADVIREAQAVRNLRNKVVHRRIDDHADLVAFEDARRILMTYLGNLPESWG